MGGGDAVEADIAQRRLALADQDRRTVDQHAVDEVRREEGRGRPRSAFDKQVVHISECVDLLRVAETCPALDGVATGQDGAPGRSILQRAEERRVGKEGVSTCRSRWAPVHKKKKKKTEN